MKRLLVAIAVLFPTSVTAQLGLCCVSHEETQLAHGYITAGVGASSALLAKGLDMKAMTGARLGSVGAVLFYTRREVQAHREYKQRYASGDFTDEEYTKVRWDSKMDVAWPLYASWVVMTADEWREKWPWWAVVGSTLWFVGRVTDPGGVALGLK